MLMCCRDFEGADFPRCRFWLTWLTWVSIYISGFGISFAVVRVMMCSGTSETKRRLRVRQSVFSISMPEYIYSLTDVTCHCHFIKQKHTRCRGIQPRNAIRAPFRQLPNNVAFLTAIMSKASWFISLCRKIDCTERSRTSFAQTEHSPPLPYYLVCRHPFRFSLLGVPV